MKIKNWKEFQHYKDRDPKWIKLYTKILNDDEWFSLDPKHAKVLVMLWLLASEDPLLDGNLPSLKKVAFRLRMSESSLESMLSALNHWVEQPASNALANGYLPASLELETEKSRDRVETEIARPALAVCAVVELWNSIPGLPKAERVTGPIEKSIATRIKEHPNVDWFNEIFHRVSRSDFLTGRKTDFVATIDWVLGPKNLAKVLNGNYDNREKVGGKDPNGFLAGMQAFLERGE